MNSMKRIRNRMIVWILLFMTITIIGYSGFKQNVTLEIDYYVEENAYMQVFYNNKSDGYPFDEINSIVDKLEIGIDGTKQ